MTLAFFACGFQLVFITTHLPAYLQLCGVAPGVSATALGLIGLFNTLGTYGFGLLGARYSQKHLLAMIYLLRTLFIVGFLLVPISATTTLIFAAAMGTLWLGVSPLVTGIIGRVFGLEHFGTLYGVVFLSHQVGSFFGAWMGGLVFARNGNYDFAWGALDRHRLHRFHAAVADGRESADAAASPPGARVKIAAADGVEIAATFYEPSVKAKGAVLIAPAMSAPQSYYRAFALWLAGEGYHVATFDYRGTGESRVGSLRGYKADIVDWASLDCAAVLEALAQRAAGLPVYWVGHSLGGQILGFIPDTVRERISKAITVATGSGYWRRMRRR